MLVAQASCHDPLGPWSLVFEFEGWCSLVHRRIIERHEINDKKSHSMTVLIVECRYDETFELSYHART